MLLSFFLFDKRFFIHVLSLSAVPELARIGPHLLLLLPIQDCLVLPCDRRTTRLSSRHVATSIRDRADGRADRSLPTLRGTHRT